MKKVKSVQTVSDVCEEGEATLNEEEKYEWPEVDEIQSVKKEEEGNSDISKKKRYRKNKFIISEEKIEEEREAQVHATRARTKVMEEKTLVEDKQVEREGVIAYDLEAVYITSQDSMPVQSTSDGDSIDLPTPHLVKPNTKNLHHSFSYSV